MTSIRYRLGVASRALAAMFGGYALSALFAVSVALMLPTRRDEAVVAGMVTSIAIYAAAVVWVFAARSAALAWVGLALPALLLGGVLVIARVGWVV